MTGRSRTRWKYLAKKGCRDSNGGDGRGDRHAKWHHECHAKCHANTIDQNEREADGGNEGQPSSKASELPASTAAPAMRQAAEPQTETAQPDARKSAALTLSQNPYVKSWRSIKSFVRRMTDMDLIVFTSSIPMFRSFLAMLRALTPYYQGPSMSLDELTELAAAPS
jgi:hypothetical protein